MGLHTSQKSLLYYLVLHNSLVKASIINSWPNPNLKEETLCEKSTSQEARGLQNTRVKEEEFSPAVGRRKTSPENAPLVVGRTEKARKAKEFVLWSWSKENNMRNYKKNLTFNSLAGSRRRKSHEKPPESQIKHKLQGFKKNHEKNQRTISYLQHTPFAGKFVVAGDRRPDWKGRRSLGRMLWSWKGKDNPRIHPLFTSNYAFAGKHGRRRLVTRRRRRRN